jgi:hypothetical protein
MHVFKRYYSFRKYVDRSFEELHVRADEIDDRLMYLAQKTWEADDEQKQTIVELETRLAFLEKEARY